MSARQDILSILVRVESRMNAQSSLDSLDHEHSNGSLELSVNDREL